MGSQGTATDGVQAQGMAAYAAPSLFQPHRARQALRDAHEGKIPPLLGYYAGLSSVPISRYLAPMNYDCVWVDWEHTSCNVETMTTIVHETIFMSHGRTIPFVRVPGHDHAAIGYALDAGASIVVPQVETVEQAKHVLSAAKYGTKHNGTRSAPPFRLVRGLTDRPYDPSRDIHRCLNDQAAVMFQIESLEGIRNLDAILTACPDADAIWLGSLDCRISMNLPGNGGMGGSEPEWQEAVGLFKETMRKHDKPYSGFYMGPPEGVKKGIEGMCMAYIDADVVALGGMYEKLGAMKQAIAQ